MSQTGAVVFTVSLSLLASWAAVVLSAAVANPVATATPRSSMDIQRMDDNPDFCYQVQQQNHVDLIKLSGWWYVVEIVGHRQEDRQSSTGYVNLTVCPTMNIYVNTDQDKVSMFWEDPVGTVLYNFQIQSKEDPGYWYSIGQQTGTYVTNTKRKYKQFAGSVQVLKAVADHLILRFCSLSEHHYSIVMSRMPNVTQQMISELNSVIFHRGLPQWDLRRACVDASSAISSTIALVASAASFILLKVALF